MLTKITKFLNCIVRVVKELSEHPTAIIITVPLETCISTSLSIGQPLPHTLKPYEINLSPIKGVLRLLLKKYYFFKRKSKFLK